MDSLGVFRHTDCPFGAINLSGMFVSCNRGGVWTIRCIWSVFVPLWCKITWLLDTKRSEWYRQCVSLTLLKTYLKHFEAYRKTLECLVGYKDMKWHYCHFAAHVFIFKLHTSRFPLNRTIACSLSKSWPQAVSTSVQGFLLFLWYTRVLSPKPLFISKRLLTLIEYFI